MKSNIRSISQKIVPILKQYNVRRASLFGSCAKGSMRKDSDIDILIEPPKGMGFGFVGIKLELEKKTGKKVDLLTYKSIHPYIKKHILSNEIRII